MGFNSVLGLGLSECRVYTGFRAEGLGSAG